MAGIESIDEELTAVHERREQCADQLVKLLIQIDTATERLNVLLDRKLNQRNSA